MFLQRRRSTLRSSSPIWALVFPCRPLSQYWPSPILSSPLAFSLSTKTHSSLSLLINVYTLLYFKWITNKVLLYSTGNSAKCYVAAWTGGEFGGEWIHVCFPGSSVNKESSCNTGDLDSIPGSRRSPGGEHGNALQYSCLENLMNRGAWQTAVHRVAKSRTRLKQLSMCAWIHGYVWLSYFAVHLKLHNFVNWLYSNIK